MGTVDDQNRANFYDGKIRVVDPDGRELAKYYPQDYRDLLPSGRTLDLSEVPLSEKVGWKGLVDGIDSGVYTATPRSRLNVSDGMATPRAQAEFEKFYEAFGSKKSNGRYQPVHHRLATHWALLELLYLLNECWNWRKIPKSPIQGCGRFPRRSSGKESAASRPLAGR